MAVAHLHCVMQISAAGSQQLPTAWEPARLRGAELAVREGLQLCHRAVHIVPVAGWFPAGCQACERSYLVEPACHQKQGTFLRM